MENKKSYKGRIISLLLIAGASLLVTFKTLDNLYSKDPYQSEKLLQKYYNLRGKVRMLNEEKLKLPNFIYENDYNSQLKEAFNQEYQKAKVLDNTIKSLESEIEEIENDSIYIKSKKRENKHFWIMGGAMGTFFISSLTSAGFYSARRLLATRN